MNLRKLVCVFILCSCSLLGAQHAYDCEVSLEENALTQFNVSEESLGAKEERLLNEFDSPKGGRSKHWVVCEIQVERDLFACELQFRHADGRQLERFAKTQIPRDLDSLYLETCYNDASETTQHHYILKCQSAPAEG